MKEEGLGRLHIATVGQRIEKWLGLQSNFEGLVGTDFYEFFMPFTFMIVHSVFSLIRLISLDIEEEWIDSRIDPGLKFCLVCDKLPERMGVNGFGEIVFEMILRLVIK